MSEMSSESSMSSVSEVTFLFLAAMKNGGGDGGGRPVRQRLKPLSERVKGAEMHNKRHKRYAHSLVLCGLYILVGC